MSAVKRAAFRVHGRVQGVGFRWWCVRIANELGVAGTVRNASDGCVEVELSGDVAAVDRMTDRLAVGPPLAGVSGLEVVPSRDVEGPEFRIIR